MTLLSNIKMGNLCYTRINTLEMVQKPFTRPYKNVMCVIQNIICLGLEAVHMPLLSCIKMCNLWYTIFNMLQFEDGINVMVKNSNIKSNDFTKPYTKVRFVLSKI